MKDRLNPTISRIVSLSLTLPLFMLASCQVSTPIAAPTNTTTNDLNKEATKQTTNSKLLPQSVTFSNIKNQDLLNSQIFKSISNVSDNVNSNGFTIQDYPQSVACREPYYNCGITSFSATLNFPATTLYQSGRSLSSFNITLAELQSGVGGGGISYGIIVQETALDPDEDIIATKIGFNVLMSAFSEPTDNPYISKSAHTWHVTFTSTDGKNFSLDSSAPFNGSEIGYAYTLQNFGGETCADAAGATAQLTPSSGTLTLDEKTKTATINLTLSGTGTANSGINYSCPGNSTKTGAASLTLSMKAPMPFVYVDPGTIGVTADPMYFSPKNQDGKFDFNKFSIISTTGKPWRIKVQGSLPGPPDSRGYLTQDNSIPDMCDWTFNGTEPTQEVEYNGMCSPLVYMPDGKYLVEAESRKTKSFAEFAIDNTPPVVESFTKTPGTDGYENYTVNVYDPLVNGVASGMLSSSMNLKVVANGTELDATGIYFTPNGPQDLETDKHYELTFKAPTTNYPVDIQVEDQVANRAMLPLGPGQGSCPPPTKEEEEQLLEDLNTLLKQLKPIAKKVERLTGRPFPTHLNSEDDSFTVSSRRDRLSQRGQQIQEISDFLDDSITILESGLLPAWKNEVVQRTQDQLDLQQQKNDFITDRDDIRSGNLPKDQKVSEIERLRQEINRLNSLLQENQQRLNELTRMVNWSNEALDAYGVTNDPLEDALVDLVNDLLDRLFEHADRYTCPPSPVTGCFRPCTTDTPPNFPGWVNINDKQGSPLISYGQSQCLDFTNHPYSAQPEVMRIFQDINEIGPLDANCFKPNVKTEPKTRTNLEWMKEGNSPCDPQGKTVELHHVGQNPLGPLVEMSKANHLAVRHSIRPSTIDRDSFGNLRKMYWKVRAHQSEYGNNSVMCQ